MSYYLVKVKVAHESEEGKIKNVTEVYLANAVSCTDAEVKVSDLFTNTTLTYEVTSVNETKIMEVIE